MIIISVDVKPEIQAELARQAAADGRAIEAYAASLLEEAVQLPPSTNGQAFDKERAQAAGARIRDYAKELRWEVDDQATDRRRPSVSRFVLDNTVTMAWCFTEEATELTETLLTAFRT